MLVSIFFLSSAKFMIKARIKKQKQKKEKIILEKQYPFNFLLKLKERKLLGYFKITYDFYFVKMHFLFKSLQFKGNCFHLF